MSGAIVRAPNERRMTAVTAPKASRICPVHPAHATTMAAHMVTTERRSVAGTMT
jgi:hypothetical protein